MQEDYRRDDRARREEEERYEDDRRRARDAGRFGPANIANLSVTKFGGVMGGYK